MPKQRSTLSEAVLAIRPGRPWPTQTRAWPTQTEILPHVHHYCWPTQNLLGPLTGLPIWKFLEPPLDFVERIVRHSTMLLRHFCWCERGLGGGGDFSARLSDDETPARKGQHGSIPLIAHALCRWMGEHMNECWSGSISSWAPCTTHIGLHATHHEHQ